MQQRLKEWGILKPFYRVTSVANDRVFKFSIQAREETRRLLKIADDQKLVIYPGKIGGIYANASQLIAVFKELASLDTRYRFLIMTSFSSEIGEALKNETAKFRDLIMVLPPVEWKSMPDYLSAADMGIVSVLPGPSQRFRSNIKVGEYLCAGLPYLICKGVSEDDLVAEKGRVGVVVEDLKPECIKLAEKKIDYVFSVPKKEMAERCREIGIGYRGFDVQFDQFKKALNCLTTS
jgi:hypothetical protein